MSPTLSVNELYNRCTVQGEGPSLGRLCTFVRLARCNLDCGEGPGARWSENVATGTNQIVKSGRGDAPSRRCHAVVPSWSCADKVPTMKTIEWAWQHARARFGATAGSFAHIDDDQLLLSLIETSTVADGIGRRLGPNTTTAVQDALLARYPDLELHASMLMLKNPSPAMLAHIASRAKAKWWAPETRLHPRIATLIAQIGTADTRRILELSGALGGGTPCPARSREDRLSLLLRDDLTADEQLATIKELGGGWEPRVLTNPTISADTLRKALRGHTFVAPFDSWQLDISTDKLRVVADHAAGRGEADAALAALAHRNSRLERDLRAELVQIIVSICRGPARRSDLPLAGMNVALLAAIPYVPERDLADQLAQPWDGVADIPVLAALENMPIAPAILHGLHPETVAALTLHLDGTLGDLAAVCAATQPDAA